MVSVAKVVPNNHNIIYCGTNASGLWVTYNSNISNPQWINLTDILRIPALGIQDILIIPNLLTPSQPTIIIAIGVGGVSYKKYGIGHPILKSNDGGLTWNFVNCVNYTFTIENVAYKLHAVKDNFNNYVLYAAIDDMLFKSYDLGDNWVKVYKLPSYSSNSNIYGHALPRKIIDIENFPNDYNKILLSTDNLLINDNPLIIFSNNGFNSSNDVVDLLSVTTNTYFLNPNFYQNLSEHERIEIDFSESNPNEFYLTVNRKIISSNQIINQNKLMKCELINCSNNICLKINKLYNNGGLESYGVFGYADGISYWFNELAVSNLNEEIIFVGGTQLYAKVFSGNFQTWEEISTYNPSTNGHADIRFMEIYDEKVSYNDPQNLINTYTISVIMCNDGGVSIRDFIFQYNTSNNKLYLMNHPYISTPWNNLSKELPITQFYDIDVLDSPSDFIIGGTQDNMGYVFNGTFWNRFGSGDGERVNFYRSKDTIFYVGNIAKYINTINTYSFLMNTNLGYSTYENYQLGLNKQKIFKFQNNNILSWAENNVYYKYLYIDNCSSYLNCNSMNLPQSNYDNFIKDFDFYEKDNNIAYAIRFLPTWNNDCSDNKNKLRVLKTTNAFSNNPTWIDLSLNICNSLSINVLAWNYLTNIIIHPENPNKVWITLGGFNNIRIIYSADGGITWSDLSNGLPNFPINDIIYEKGSNDGLYVATDVGVFYTNNDIYPTQGWVCFNQGLPVCIVTDLEINYKQNKIYAATFGRGVWKSDLFCPSDYDLSFSSPAANLNNTFKEAQNNILITTTSGLWSVQDFTARAGNEISVSAQSGGEFVLYPHSHLFIHPCNSPGNSFRTNPALNQKQTTSASSSFNKSEYFSSVKLYPNPFDDEITIDSDSEWLKYEIYHTHGTKLHEGSLTRSRKIQTASLKTGIYLIRITDHKLQSFTFKMIKL